jgi:UDP-2-acetamido-2-deoxy-ribo-hexuluronate aminotransferase
MATAARSSPTTTRLAQAAREIRVHGQSKRYTHTRVGVGGRMDTLQCAVVLAKLERFEWELERRAAIGARYRRLLADAGVALWPCGPTAIASGPSTR